MLSQIDVFHDCFDQIEGPRVPGRTTHPLNSILFLVVAATIADADGPEEIECFGNERLDWLSRFADFPHGTPSRDPLARHHRSSPVPTPTEPVDERANSRVASTAC